MYSQWVKESIDTVKACTVMLLVTKILIHVIPEETYVPYVQCMVDFMILLFFLKLFAEWFNLIGGIL